MTSQLSTMMSLGDPLRSRNAGTYLSATGSSDGGDSSSDGGTGWCGCALGGAQLAMGQTGYMAWLKLWPWLNQHDADSQSPYWKVINLKFLQVEQGQITFEQLVDWVRSVEPQQADQDGGVAGVAGVAGEMEQLVFEMRTGG